MRKVISMITVFVLCFTLAVPAFASSVGFVPSITAKPAPEVVVTEHEPVAEEADFAE